MPRIRNRSTKDFVTKGKKIGDQDQESKKLETSRPVKI